MGESDKKAAVVLNVPLACGSVFFAIAGVSGLLADPPWLSPGDAVSFVLFVLTPFLSVAAVWSVARVRIVLFAIPAMAGSILQGAWVYNASRILLYWEVMLPPKDAPDLSGALLVLYFLYGCALVANAVLLILRCAVSRRPQIPAGTP